MTRHLQANEIDSDTHPLTIGATVQINQVTDRFINPPEANSLRLRKARHPYSYPVGS